jgi:O-methyltransferase
VVKSLVRNVFDRMGLKILGKGHYLFLDQDMDPEFKPLYHRCKKYTLTEIERMYALYNATRYLSAHQIPGAVVECGVWQGGSMMLVAETLRLAGDTNRSLYLYDTFEGMSKPTEKDITFKNTSAAKWFQYSDEQEYAVAENLAVSLAVPVERVRQNIAQTGYPMAHVQFVKGKVEETLPGTLPEQIALLRLDTDWYESTYHELVHLFPHLVPGGVLIVDDYGHWKGAREAVDQYFKENHITMLLHRVDYSCRIGVKTSL